MYDKLSSSISNSLFLGVFFICASASQAVGEVGIGVNINIGPPPIIVAAPPAVVMVPQISMDMGMIKITDKDMIRGIETGWSSLLKVTV